MSNAQDIANKFMQAYTEYNWVYGRIQDECMFLFGSAKSFSVEAVDWLEMNEDNIELWILENVVTKLDSVNWPKYGSKEFHEAVYQAYHAAVFGA